MSKSGGYKVIDLGFKPLSNFVTVYPGIYEQIESTNKLCVISGLNAGGTEYDDVAVLFTGGKTLTAQVSSTITLKINDNDEVTVAVDVEVPAVYRLDASKYESGVSVTDDATTRAVINAVAAHIPILLIGFGSGGDVNSTVTHIPVYQSHFYTHASVYYIDWALGKRLSLYATNINHTITITEEDIT